MMTVLVNIRELVGYLFYIYSNKFLKTVIRQAIVFILFVLPVQKWTPGVYRLQNNMPGNGI